MVSEQTQQSVAVHPANYVKLIVLASLFAALTATGAMLRIPIPPVPITLQMLFVFLAGGLLGPWGGLTSQCMYLMVGLSGAPVFSGGGGIGYIFDPRFGYLIGFPAAALLIGFLSNRVSSKETDFKRAFFAYFCIYSAGAAVIYITGLSYLFFYAETFAGTAFSIIWAGFLVFIPIDILKIAVSAWLTIRLRRIGIYAG